MITFAWNRSSWDEEADKPLPGSMCDLITEPVTRHMDSACYGLSRNPQQGHINLYSSSRSNYQNNLQRGERLGVLISHGIADKGIRNKLGHMFDKTIVPSDLYADVLLRNGVKTSSVVVLGYSKLDPIFNGEIEPLPRDDRIRVLYAPTQGGGGDMNHMNDTKPPNIEGVKRTSWWKRDEVLNLLDPDVFDVVPCFHPRYTEGHKATLQEYLGADVVIADGGSTLWEAMVLGIPVVTPYWITGFGNAAKGTLEGRLYRRGIVRHAIKASHLSSLVREAAIDGQRPAELALAKKVLPEDLRGTSGKVHAEWIKELERLH